MFVRSLLCSTSSNSCGRWRWCFVSLRMHAAPPQNLETLDVSALTPLTPEVISRQATINIGAWMMRSVSQTTTKHLNRHHWPCGAR